MTIQPINTPARRAVEARQLWHHYLILFPRRITFVGDSHASRVTCHIVLRRWSKSKKVWLYARRGDQLLGHRGTCTKRARNG